MSTTIKQHRKRTVARKAEPVVEPAPVPIVAKSPAKPAMKSPAKSPAVAPKSPSKSPAKSPAKAVEEKAPAKAVEEKKVPYLECIDRIRTLREVVKNKDIAYDKISRELKALEKLTCKAHRASTLKKKEKRQSVTGRVSGIQKPAKLSPEMYQFTGFDPTKEYSRVDITRFLCQYIKDKDLKNPEQKKQIMIEKDPELMKILKFDPSTEPPLTYPRLQKYFTIPCTKKTDKTA